MSWDVAAGAALAWLCFVLLMAWGMYAILTLPLRRRERARVFLRLLEIAVREGRSIEHAIVAINVPKKLSTARRILLFRACLYGVGLIWLVLRPRELGYGFSALARKLRKGMGLVEALRRVPGFVPRQVVEILAVGEKLGDIGKVLPACQLVVEDARSRIRAAMNYLVLVVCTGILMMPVVIAIVQRWILSPFDEMTRTIAWHWDVRANPLFHTLQAVLHSPLLFWGVMGTTGFVLLCIFFYSVSLSIMALGPARCAADFVATLLPWRRRRLQRDFSFLLAVLLDAGVPEPEAVMLAGRGTANWVFIRRGKAVVEELGRGMTLTDAIHRMDGTGELRWRLANAVHGSTGFMRALAGWHDALEAKADQQEQAAAQVITTGLLLCNGVIVGMLAIAVFQVLISLIYEAAPW